MTTTTSAAGPLAGTALAAPALRASTLAERRLAALVAVMLGLGLLFASGFAGAEVLHNAAHDWRHAHNFPCH